MKTESEILITVKTFYVKHKTLNLLWFYIVNDYEHKSLFIIINYNCLLNAFEPESIAL